MHLEPSLLVPQDEMPELDIQLGARMVSEDCDLLAAQLFSLLLQRSCPFPLLYRGNELDSEPEIRDGFHNAPWAEWRFNMSGSLRHQQLTLFWSCH